MKNLILSAAALFAFGFANAQDTEEGTKGFAKGDLFLTGSFAFASESTGDDKANVFTIAPSAAMFLTENIALGAQISYSSFKGEEGGDDTVDASTIGFGVYGQYYFTPANDFSLFAQLGVGYATTDNKLGDFQSNEISVVLAPGISYFVSEHFALQANWGLLGYSTNDNGGDGADSTDNFALSADLSNINFGLVYKF